jgi:hypothetical protein
MAPCGECGAGAGRSPAAAAAGAARKAGARHLEAETLATDHSFSDMRIALAGRLVTWLGQFGR